MLSQVKQYLKVRRQAVQLMMSGDLQRYMLKLREMHQLRKQLGGLVA